MSTVRDTKIRKSEFVVKTEFRRKRKNEDFEKKKWRIQEIGDRKNGDV